MQQNTTNNRQDETEMNRMLGQPASFPAQDPVPDHAPLVEEKPAPSPIPAPAVVESRAEIQQPVPEPSFNFLQVTVVCPGSICVFVLWPGFESFEEEKGWSYI